MSARNPRFVYRYCTIAVGMTALLLAQGCASKEEAAPEAEAPETASAETPAASPQVFFVGLEDGATVPKVVDLVFGAENFTIEPVGDGFVHEGYGHFHIGIDTDCLPAGTVIPTADPWIHFGDGSNTITMDLSPGEHTLVLQVGDGEHRTLADPGLCHVIGVTVEEEAA